MKTKPSILVVGAGYVGLATAVFLADKGFPVTVADTNPDIIDRLQRGRLHFREPKLAARLRDVVKSKRLRPSLTEKKRYEAANVVYIAIDSANRNNWSMRLEPFEQIAGWIGGVKRKAPPTVVLKSTNIMGFAEQFRKLLDNTPHGKAVKLVVNPEFLREGMAYEDTEKPWRIILGTREKRDAARLVMIYRHVYPKSIPVINTDWKSAELIKLASNTYLAYRLAYIHELAEFARGQGLDIDALRQGIGLDPRIGQDYFNPGLGFGGSCLPKDCNLLNSKETSLGYRFESARVALDINSLVLENMIDLLKDKLGSLKGKKVALLGVAFKAEVDDTRDSRAVELAKMLRRRHVKLAVHDPLLGSQETIPDTTIPLEPNSEAALRGASAVIIGCPHRRFSLLKPKEVAVLMRKKLVFDYFRILNPRGWKDAGFDLVR